MTHLSLVSKKALLATIFSLVPLFPLVAVETPTTNNPIIATKDEILYAAVHTGHVAAERIMTLQTLGIILGIGMDIHKWASLQSNQGHLQSALVKAAKEKLGENITVIKQIQQDYDSAYFWKKIWSWTAIPLACIAVSLYMGNDNSEATLEESGKIAQAAAEKVTNSTFKGLKAAGNAAGFFSHAGGLGLLSYLIYSCIAINKELNQMIINLYEMMLHIYNSSPLAYATDLESKRDLETMRQMYEAIRPQSL